MQLSIRINGNGTTPAARHGMAEEVDNALSKFASHLRHVTLSLSDVNGPRGGKDKHCRCVLYMKRAQPIVIEDLDVSLGAAVHRAIERAVYAVSQRISKVATRRLGRRAEAESS